MATQLSQTDLAQLKSWLDAGDRAGFYLQYYMMTGSNEALLQSLVSSYSGQIGQLALHANAAAKAYLQLRGRAADYPGSTDDFSLIIANELFRSIKADVDDGGSGILSDQEIFQLAKNSWIIRNIEDCFPGNFLNPGVVGTALNLQLCTFVANLYAVNTVASLSLAEAGRSAGPALPPGSSVFPPPLPPGGQQMTSPDGKVSWFLDVDGHVVLGSVVRNGPAPLPFTFGSTTQNGQINIDASFATAAGQVHLVETLGTTNINGTNIVTSQNAILTTPFQTIQFATNPNGIATLTLGSSTITLPQNTFIGADISGSDLRLELLPTVSGVPRYFSEALSTGAMTISINASAIATVAAGSQITVDSTSSIQMADPDVGNSQLWTSRWVDIDPSGHTIADIRDYTAVANDWMAHHTLPTTNMWRADSGFITDFSAQIERASLHGLSLEQPVPEPIAFERTGFGFDLGSYAFDPSAATFSLGGSSGSGSGFDFSGYAYGGGGALTLGLKVSFATNLMDVAFGGLGWLFPVVLDLDGNGVRIEPRADSRVFFNADGDTALERTAWVGAGDGMLARDLDGNGQITFADEVAFANLTPNPNDSDLEALATLYDTNADHVLNAADAEWSQLRVWKDANRNGKSDAGELLSLAAWGISSISLVSDHRSFSLPDGSRIEGFGSFVMGGVTRSLAA